MTNFRPASIGDSDNIIQGTPFPRPTSHEYLTPPVLQRNKHYLGVELLQQQELLKRKVTPGLYSKWNEIKGFLPDVQDSLIDSLCAELHGLDPWICVNVYMTPLRSYTVILSASDSSQLRQFRLEEDRTSQWRALIRAWQCLLSLWRLDFSSK